MWSRILNGAWDGEIHNLDQILTISVERERTEETQFSTHNEKSCPYCFLGDRPLSESEYLVKHPVKSDALGDFIFGPNESQEDDEQGKGTFF